MNFRILSTLTNRSRLLDIRSRSTINALVYCSGSELRDESSISWYNTVSQYFDISSLSAYCFPENYKFISSSHIRQLALRISLCSSGIISISNDGGCSCKVLNGNLEQCTCASFHASNIYSSLNFSLHCLTVLIFLNMGNFLIVFVFYFIGFDNMEELFTRIYVTFLFRIQGKPPSAVDVVLKETRKIDCITNVKCGQDFTNIEDDFLKRYRTPVIHSTSMNHLILLNSNLSKPCDFSVGESMCQNFLNSLESTESYLASDCSVEEGLRWFRLAVRFSYIANDIYSIVYSSWLLTLVYFIWKRDYQAGVEEAEKLLRYCRTSLPHLPSSVRCFIQFSFIRRLVEYKSGKFVKK